MTTTVCNILQMDLENYLPLKTVAEHHNKSIPTCQGEEDCYRQRCGCLRTSEKLKQILSTFPTPPPPTPAPTSAFVLPHMSYLEPACKSMYCNYNHHQTIPIMPTPVETVEKTEKYVGDSTPVVERTINVSRPWRIITELVQVIQLSVTATALALYYLIYCYMQLVYYTLRSALYFHNADGPMKITIGVVTVTSLVVGFNLILKIERLIGIFR